MARLRRSVSRAPWGLQDGHGEEQTPSTEEGTSLLARVGSLSAADPESLPGHAPNGAVRRDDGVLSPHVIHPFDPSTQRPEKERAALVADDAPEMHSEREPRRTHQLKTLISAVFVLGALACIAATLPGPWVLVGTIVMGLSVTWRRGVNRQELLTVLFGISVGVTAVDYLAWRAGVTNWGGWQVAVLLLAAEIFGALHMLGLQYTVWPWPRRQLVRADDSTRRPIFVLMPTVNEGPSVLTPTIQGAVAGRRRYLEAFPDGRVTIVVCNDSGWPASRTGAKSRSSRSDWV